MRRLLLLLGCLLWTSPSWAAIAVDGSPASSGVRDGFSTATISLTVNSANSTIVIGIAARDVTDTDRVVSTLTWNGSGTGCAEARTDTETAISNLTSFVWYCTNPATGTHDIVVTMVGVNDEFGAGAVVLTGVDQVTPVDTSNGATSTNSSGTVSTSVTTVSGAFVVDALMDTSNNASTSQDGSQTLIDELALLAGGDTGGVSYKSNAGGGAMSMVWTDGVGQDYAHTVVSFKPAASTRRPSLPILLNWLFDLFSPQEAYAK